MKKHVLEDKIQELTLQLHEWKANPAITPEAIVKLEKALHAYEQQYREKHVEN